LQLALAVDPHTAEAAVDASELYRQTLIATVLLRLDAGADRSAGDAGLIIDQLIGDLSRINRYERCLHARLRRLEKGEVKSKGEK
jgi:hypothetical protein